jgi:hypothetical protein
MLVTLPILLVLTVAILGLLRMRHYRDGLTLFEFILCAAWGFLLSQSAFAPLAQSLLDAFTNRR